MEYKSLNTVIPDAISDAFSNVLNEGIDFDIETKTVTYNPVHEDNVETSISTNPTVDVDIVPNIKVWSIFKRKHGMRGDGNPLIYALKGENGWKFKSNRDYDLIERQFERIATKFASLYPVGVTIIVPSSNVLNDHIAKVVTSKSKDAIILQGVICKMTTQEVDDIVLDFDSKFRDYYGDEFTSKYQQLARYLDEMDDEKKGQFTRHLVKDNEMRDVLDFTFKVSDYRYAAFANKINGQEILIIDDTISRGQSIKEICNIIAQTYAPKSITVLTLLSKLY